MANGQKGESLRSGIWPRAQLTQVVWHGQDPLFHGGSSSDAGPPCFSAGQAMRRACQAQWGLVPAVQWPEGRRQWGRAQQQSTRHWCICKRQGQCPALSPSLAVRLVLLLLKEKPSLATDTWSSLCTLLYSESPHPSCQWCITSLLQNLLTC